MKLIDILVEELPKRGGWPDGAVECCRHNGTNSIDFYDANGNWNDDCYVIYGKDFAKDAIYEENEYKLQSITRDQYEAALAAKNDGWIDWGGGECPVNPSEMVDVIFGRGGRVSTNIADCWRWNHSGTDSDIIAYRLHKPQEVTEADDESDLNECIGQDAAQVWGGEGKPAIGEKCEHHSGGQWEAVTIAGIYENLVTGFTDYWMVKEDGSSYTVGNPYRFRPIRSEADKRREEAIKDMTLTGWCDSAAEEMYDLIAAGKVRGVKLED